MQQCLNVLCHARFRATYAVLVLNCTGTKCGPRLDGYPLSFGTVSAGGQ
jgi:hypothetical protein